MTIGGLNSTALYFGSVPAASFGTGSLESGGQSGSFVIDDELTTQDKSLISAASGSLDLPDGKINTLAMQIALDRYSGNIQGPVTTSYINNIGQQEARDGTNAISQSVLSKALDYLSQQSKRNAVILLGQGNAVNEAS